MDERKNNNHPWDDSVYGTGRTEPPKSHGGTVALLLILIMLTVFGMFMETTVITLIVTPILIPIITQYGIDPVHFGIIMMTIVTMGCSTPPVGVALYTCSNIMDCSVQETTKYSLPLFIAIMATLAICVFFPDLVLFLPNMIYGTSM